MSVLWLTLQIHTSPTAHLIVISAKSIERISASQCPFMHGTVSAGPYPGYIQGKDARVCPKGCTPQLHPTATETPLEALQREAEEFCMLYHSEKKLSDEVKDRRWSQILASIRATGTYELSSEELEHGAKVSWRNAPKCPNRSKWEELTVKDCRGITTNEEAFHNILDLFEESITSGATITRMAVFPAKGSNQVQGPRIWNGMLLRFAGYRLEDGTILGNETMWFIECLSVDIVLVFALTSHSLLILRLID